MLSPEKYMSGAIDLDSLITEEIPFREINQAFIRLHEGKSIRTVLRF